MVITENKLRDIVKLTITNMLKESIGGGFEPDDWKQPEDMEDDDVEISDEDIVIEPDEQPEDAQKAADKQKRTHDLIKNILAKQGYKGEALEREVNKRLGRSKTSAASAMDDSFYNSAEDVWVGGRNYGIVDSGVGYDGDFDDLYESKIRKVVREALKKCM